MKNQSKKVKSDSQNSLSGGTELNNVPMFNLKLQQLLPRSANAYSLDDNALRWMSTEQDARSAGQPASGANKKAGSRNTCNWGITFLCDDRTGNTCNTGWTFRCDTSTCTYGYTFRCDKSTF
jgi:hypothetical protein